MSMISITDGERRVLAWAGAVTGCAALALAPLCARSAFAPMTPAAFPKPASLRAAVDAAATLPPVADPFARALPERSLAPRLPVALPVLPPNRGAGGTLFGLPPSLPRVTAIVSGARSFALLDEGGSARIVTQGDLVAGTRVSAIDADGVRLGDGALLRVGGDHP
jgi:hypothetical protein